MLDDMATSKPVFAFIGGTGKEGPGLALRFAYVGYPVMIGSRSLEKAETVASELNSMLEDGEIRGLTNESAAQEADVVVLTVVQSAHKTVVENLKPYLAGKLVIDATARVDYRDPKPPQQPSAPRIAQEILGDSAPVVAAFQNIPAHILKKDLGKKLPAHVLVCADVPKYAEQVIRFISDIGFEGFYAGNLDNAIVVEGLTAILIAMNKYYKTKKASILVTGTSG